MPQASWKRLFIYPRATQNPYFSRYDVAESFPGNRSDSLAALNENTSERARDGDHKARIYMVDEG